MKGIKVDVVVKGWKQPMEVSSALAASCLSYFLSLTSDVLHHGGGAHIPRERHAGGVTSP
jgi:hypothetical protein